MQPTTTTAPTTTVTTTPGAGDLAIAKQVNSTAADVLDSGRITWTVTVSNVGGTTVNGPITAVDTIPPSQGYASAVGTGWDCTAEAQLVTCVTQSSVEAGQALPGITIETETITDAAIYTNGVDVQAEDDTNISNNHAEAQIDTDTGVSPANANRPTTTVPFQNTTEQGTPVPNQLALNDNAWANTPLANTPLAKTGLTPTATIVLGIMLMLGGILLLGLTPKRRRRQQ